MFKDYISISCCTVFVISISLKDFMKIKSNWMVLDICCRIVYSYFIVCHPLYFVRHLIVILQIVENSSFLILCNILHHHQILFSLLFFEPTVLLTNKLSIVFTLFVCLHACYLQMSNNRGPWIIYKCFSIIEEKQYYTRQCLFLITGDFQFKVRKWDSRYNLVTVELVLFPYHLIYLRRHLQSNFKPM